MNAKYKLLPKKRVKHSELPLMGSRLYQIEALRDIPRYGVKAGDLGGYVDSGQCLSQEGDCWVREGSIVIHSRSEHGSVNGNALVEGSYFVKESVISHEARVSGDNGMIWFTEIGGNSTIKGSVNLSFCDFDNDVYVEHAPMLEKFEYPVIRGVDEQTLIIKSGNLRDAKIVGFGELKVHSWERFDLEGCFRLDLGPLDSPFKAQGQLELLDMKISCPVTLSGKIRMSSSSITGNEFNMEVKDSIINNSTFDGITKISGENRIKFSKFEGENTLNGNIIIGGMSSFRGKNKILGTTMLPAGSYLINQTIVDGNMTESNAVDGTDEKMTQLNNILRQNIKIGQPVTSEANVSIVDNHQDIDTAVYVELIHSVEADYEAYTTDIVKLIKYPAMGDSSVPETRRFIVALRAARRAITAGHQEKLMALSADLEHAFVEAESKAIILAATFMDGQQKQSLKRANQALAIALDENATEHERRAGYKSGMKSLEGILPVSEEAVFALKERIGLKEIEA